MLPEGKSRFMSWGQPRIESRVSGSSSISSTGIDWRPLRFWFKREHRLTAMPKFQLVQVRCCDAGCVDPKEVWTDRLIGGERGIYSLGDEDVKVLWVQVAAGELSETPRCHPLRGEHEGEIVPSPDHRSQPLIKSGEAAVPGFRFLKATVVKSSHLDVRFEGSSVKLVGLAAHAKDNPGAHPLQLCLLNSFGIVKANERTGHLHPVQLLS